jgi:hypothetical protein
MRPSFGVFSRLSLARCRLRVWTLILPLIRLFCGRDPSALNHRCFSSLSLGRKARIAGSLAVPECSLSRMPFNTSAPHLTTMFLQPRRSNGAVSDMAVGPLVLLGSPKPKEQSVKLSTLRCPIKREDRSNFNPFNRHTR